MKLTITCPIYGRILQPEEEKKNLVQTLKENFQTQVAVDWDFVANRIDLGLDVSQLRARQERVSIGRDAMDPAERFPGRYAFLRRALDGNGNNDRALLDAQRQERLNALRRDQADAEQNRMQILLARQRREEHDLQRARQQVRQGMDPVLAANLPDRTLDFINASQGAVEVNPFVQEALDLQQNVSDLLRAALANHDLWEGQGRTLLANFAQQIREARTAFPPLPALGPEVVQPTAAERLRALAEEEDGLDPEPAFEPRIGPANLFGPAKIRPRDYEIEATVIVRDEALRDSLRTGQPIHSDAIGHSRGTFFRGQAVYVASQRDFDEVAQVQAVGIAQCNSEQMKLKPTDRAHRGLQRNQDQQQQGGPVYDGPILAEVVPHGKNKQPPAAVVCGPYSAEEWRKVLNYAADVAPSHDLAAVRDGVPVLLTAGDAVPMTREVFLHFIRSRPQFLPQLDDDHVLWNFLARIRASLQVKENFDCGEGILPLLERIYNERQKHWELFEPCRRKMLDECVSNGKTPMRMVRESRHRGAQRDEHEFFTVDTLVEDDLKLAFALWRQRASNNGTEGQDFKVNFDDEDGVCIFELTVCRFTTFFAGQIEEQYKAALARILQPPTSDDPENALRISRLESAFAEVAGLQRLLQTPVPEKHQDFLHAVNAFSRAQDRKSISRLNELRVYVNELMPREVDEWAKPGDRVAVSLGADGSMKGSLNFTIPQ